MKHDLLRQVGTPTPRTDDRTSTPLAPGVQGPTPLPVPQTGGRDSQQAPLSGGLGELGGLGGLSTLGAPQPGPGGDFFGAPVQLKKNQGTGPQPPGPPKKTGVSKHKAGERARKALVAKARDVLDTHKDVGTSDEVLDAIAVAPESAGTVVLRTAALPAFEEAVSALSTERHGAAIKLGQSTANTSVTTHARTNVVNDTNREKLTGTDLGHSDDEDKRRSGKALGRAQDAMLELANSTMKTAGQQWVTDEAKSETTALATAHLLTPGLATEVETAATGALAGRQAVFEKVRDAHLSDVAASDEFETARGIVKAAALDADKGGSTAAAQTEAANQVTVAPLAPQLTADTIKALVLPKLVATARLAAEKKALALLPAAKTAALNAVKKATTLRNDARTTLETAGKGSIDKQIAELDKVLDGTGTPSTKAKGGAARALSSELAKKAEHRLHDRVDHMVDGAIDMTAPKPFPDDAALIQAFFADDAAVKDYLKKHGKKTIGAVLRNKAVQAHRDALEEQHDTAKATVDAHTLAEVEKGAQMAGKRIAGDTSAFDNTWVAHGRAKIGYDAYKEAALEPTRHGSHRHMTSEGETWQTDDSKSEVDTLIDTHVANDGNVTRLKTDLLAKARPAVTNHWKAIQSARKSEVHHHDEYRQAKAALATSLAAGKTLDVWHQVETLTAAGQGIHTLVTGDPLKDAAHTDAVAFVKNATSPGPLADKIASDARAAAKAAVRDKTVLGGEARTRLETAGKARTDERITQYDTQIQNLVQDPAQAARDMEGSVNIRSVAAGKTYGVRIRAERGSHNVLHQVTATAGQTAAEVATALAAEINTDAIVDAVAVGSAVTVRTRPGKTRFAMEKHGDGSFGIKEPIRETRRKAVLKDEYASANVLFLVLGGLCETLVPSIGDKNELKAKLRIPVHPPAFVGCRFKGELERGDDGQIKLRIEIAFQGGATLGFGNIAGEIGAYLESQAPSGEGVFDNINYALYRRMKESLLWPEALVNLIWGFGGQSAAPGQKPEHAKRMEAAMWGASREAGMHDGSYVEGGMLLGGEVDWDVPGVTKGEGGLRLFKGRHLELDQHGEMPSYVEENNMAQRIFGLRPKRRTRKGYAAWNLIMDAKAELGLGPLGSGEIGGKLSLLRLGTPNWGFELEAALGVTGGSGGISGIIDHCGALASSVHSLIAQIIQRLQTHKKMKRGRGGGKDVTESIEQAIGTLARIGDKAGGAITNGVTTEAQKSLSQGINGLVEMKSGVKGALKIAYNNTPGSQQFAITVNIERSRSVKTPNFGDVLTIENEATERIISFGLQVNIGDPDTGKTTVEGTLGGFI